MEYNTLYYLYNYLLIDLLFNAILKDAKSAA